MTGSESDRKGIFSVQADLRQPWRRFIDELAPHRPQLLRFCCRLAGNLWDGEDLLQDALARVFTQLGRAHAEITDPRAYLCRTAANLWIDRYRRMKLELAHAEIEPGIGEDADPARGLDVRAASDHLFLHLPPKERATLVLSDIMDFRLSEIAGMLKMTLGAVKSALHRGRKRLQSADAIAPRASSPPRDVVDKFVAALTARDFEAIKALCLESVTVEMVGGSSFEGFDDSKMTFEYAHFVKPEWGFGESPNWRVAEYQGETIVLGFRTLNGIEGLNDIWRFEMGDGGIERLRLYCFSPDVIATLAGELDVPALPRPYRSPA